MIPVSFNPMVVWYAIIQTTISIVFLYLVAEFTGAVQILNLWVLIVLYAGLNVIKNIVIPGRWK